MFLSNNKQELLDIVYTGVIAQGGTSTDNFGTTCRYNGNDGTRKCAAALCMTNKAFNATAVIEESGFDKGEIHLIGSIAEQLLTQGVIKQSPKVETLQFVRKLQKVHDYSESDGTYSIAKFTNDMRDLADEENLIFNK